MTVPVVGLDGSDPAGAVRLVAPGGYIVTYRSNRAFTVVPSAEFEQYVSEKGLEKAEARRGKRSAGRGGVREAYSRHSKALVNVGKPGTGTFDRATRAPPRAHCGIESCRARMPILRDPFGCCMKASRLPARS